MLDAVRTTADVTLPLTLDRHEDRPLPRQVADGLRALVADGVLVPGDALPSTRALAAHLGVARGTVVAAYEQLTAEGYLRATTGGATRVDPGAGILHGPLAAPAGRAPTPAVPEALADLRPGRPWLGALAGPGWRRAWRDAAAHPDAAGAQGLGLPELREQLADHLRQMRGMVRSPEHIVVTAGAREGLALLLTALHLPRRVGVEVPGYPSLRRVPERLGAEVVGLRVDGLGLVTDALPTTEVPSVVLVTPSHQHPLGGSLPVGRRRALLAWARTHGVWVVEDDYDSELRYTSEPLPALAALDDPHDGRVVTLGTFATTLAPGVGVGFLVAPEPLLPQLEAARADLGQPVSAVTQRAIAGHLASGELRRHTQRMRALYRRRRRWVAEALSGLPGVRVAPMHGGLHAVVQTDRPEAEVLADAAASGVLVTGLSSYWAGAEPDASGIVLGFGAATDAQLAGGLAVLADACSGRVSR